MNKTESKSGRLYMFDNLKALLIVLVVLVHFVSAVAKLYGSNRWASLFLVAACSFHMPLFVFISGYFSKNVQKARDNAGKILLMYGIGQVLLVVLRYFVKGESITLAGLLRPQFSMWYLLALFIWRYFLKDLLHIRYIIWICLFLNVAVMGTDFQVYTLRILSFAVYFLLGFYTDEDVIRKMRRRGTRWIFWGVLAACGASIWWVVRSGLISAAKLRGMMLRTVTVSDIEAGPVSAYCGFLYVFLLAVLVSVSLLALVPNKKMWFSYVGRNSLTIYIGQALLYIVLYYKVFRWDVFSENVQLAWFAAIILSLLCVLVCGSRPVADGFAFAVDKILKFLDRRNVFRYNTKK